MSVPNPTLLATLAKKRQVAFVEPDVKAKVVRPGEKAQRIHDGVVKTKHLKPGMTVRPHLHGEARGGERVIGAVTKVGDGATWLVEFTSAHVAQEFKAAYRWYCEALDGMPIKDEPRRRRPAAMPVGTDPIASLVDDFTRVALDELAKA